MAKNNDVASVYFVVEADSTGVSKADKDVSKLGLSSDKAAQKVSKLNQAAKGGWSIFSLTGKALKEQVNNVNSLIKGYTTLTQKMNTNTRAVDRNKKTLMELRRIQKQQLNDQSALFTAATGEQQKAKNALGDNARGAAQANRFNSANMLAQVQDILVSAQMKMNPLTIAIQQGTQLQYILAQSKAPLKDFIAGLKSAVSVTGLLAIALTGLVAAGIQMVDWVSVGKTTLNGLASVFDYVAKNADIFATSITLVASSFILLKAKSIASITLKVVELGVAFAETTTIMALGWLKAMGPVGWVIATIGVVTGLILKFKNEISNLIPKSWKDSLEDFGKALKDKINTWIGWLKTFVNLWKTANDVSLLDAFNGKKRNEVDEKIKKIIKDSKTGKKVDYLGNVSKGLSEGATAVSNQLKKWSENLGISESKSKKIKDYWADIVRNAEQSMADKKLEASMLGKPEQQQIYEKTLQNLMQQAEDKEIALDDKKIGKLKDLAEGYAKVSVEVNKLTEAYTESKSIFKGFFSDMRQGLLEGESAWESFGNAVLNVLNKIQEKLMDKTTDLLFDALWNVGSAYFSTPSTTGGSTAEVNRLGDLGASVGRKPMIAAANGGVFSNGIYDSPTLFKFARGGRFGVMGEAGPEAVMPLTRGPDGSLGVKAEGAGGSPVIVNVINNSNAQARTEQRQTSQGVELDVIIDNLVADKMNKNGSASNSALKAFSSQSLVMR